jgi:hypothetical protein
MNCGDRQAIKIRGVLKPMVWFVSVHRSRCVAQSPQHELPKLLVDGLGSQRGQNCPICTSLGQCLALGDASRKLVYFRSTTKKNRIEIPAELVAQALFESDRTCCVRRLRKPAQIHHIDEDPANCAKGKASECLQF